MTLPDPQTTVVALAAQPEIRTALDALSGETTQTLDEAIAIQQIPAPTFDEAARAAHLARTWASLKLADVETDATGNVYARIPGSAPHSPAVMLSAHLDTVFPAGTDLSVRREDKRVYGAGLGDNSLGLAGLLAVARKLNALKKPLLADVWLVATVGEEGLGNLRGMRAALEHLRERVGIVICLEGLALGRVFHRGLGVRRLNVRLEGPGGHAWLNYGQPSAVHSLLRLGANLTRLRVTHRPRTSFNIGLIEGGTSINTIAPQASMSIDLRAEDASALQRLDMRLRKAIDSFRLPGGLNLETTVIGERPSGALPEGHPLAQAAGDALRTAGLDHVLYSIASTDANIPLAAEVPAVCIGITTGGGAHSASEYVDVEPIPHGLQQVFLLTVAAADNAGAWSVWDNVG